jgi:predicted Zn-dependent peptidase
MKKTLTTYDIAHELMQDDNANWTRAGAFALAEYLEQYEEDCGEEIELDVVAIRCDYSEYYSLEDFASEYFSDNKQAADALGLELTITEDEFEEEEEEIQEAIRNYIQDNGQLIEFDGGIIVSSF